MAKLICIGSLCLITHDVQAVVGHRTAHKFVNCCTHVTGSLPPSWSAPGALPSLSVLHLQDTLLTGSLPPSWANQEALPSLFFLYLDGNLMTGSLPQSWLNKNAFPEVVTLVLSHNLMTGSLPPSLSKGFPALGTLVLGPSRQNGTLPAEWGSSGSFPHLSNLQINGSNITGLDAFNSAPVVKCVRPPLEPR